jgi:hypothetical protein
VRPLSSPCVVVSASRVLHTNQVGIANPVLCRGGKPPALYVVMFTRLPY